MHYIYQTLPSPRVLLKAIRAGVGFGSGTETRMHDAYDVGKHPDYNKVIGQYIPEL